MTNIEPHYYAFVDLVDFHDLALGVMGELVRDVPELRMEVNPDLMEAFMDLYAVLVQTVLLCGAIEERKLLISFHAVLYGSLHAGQKEPAAQNVLAFMKDYPGGENTTKKLWENMKAFGPRVIPALVTLFPNWIKVRNVDALRNDGVLSLNLAPAKLLLPSSLPIYEEILRAPKVNLWFYFGFLYSPEELVTVCFQESTLKVDYETGEMVKSTHPDSMFLNCFSSPSPPNSF